MLSSYPFLLELLNKVEALFGGLNNSNNRTNGDSVMMRKHDYG